MAKRALVPPPANPPPPAAKEAKHWVTRKDAAEVVGLSPKQFDDRVRPALPDSATRGSGKQLRIHLPTAVQAWDRQNVEAAAKPADDGEGDDLMFAKADSPALEAYRHWRAKMAQLDYEQRRGSVVPVEKLRNGWGAVAVILRRALEHLQRRHGQDAADLMIDALEESDRVIEEATRQEGEEEAGDQAEAPDATADAGSHRRPRRK